MYTSHTYQVHNNHAQMKNNLKNVRYYTILCLWPHISAQCLTSRFNYNHLLLLVKERVGTGKNQKQK